MTISKAAGGVIILSHLSFFLLCCLSVCLAALYSHLRESLISRAVTQTVCDSFPGEYSYSLCLADLRVAKVLSHLSQEKNTHTVHPNTKCIWTHNYTCKPPRYTLAAWLTNMHVAPFRLFKALSEERSGCVCQSRTARWWVGVRAYSLLRRLMVLYVDV